MEGLYIQLRPGVLEVAGRSYRVDHLDWLGQRQGYVRELHELGRWRWVVPDPGGDYVGDEPTQRLAARVAQYCVAQRWMRQQQKRGGR